MQKPYIVIVYEGPPDYGKLRGVARDCGATRLAVHINADGASIHDTRVNSKRTNPPKIWSIDKIGEVLAEYDRLFDGLRDPVIRCIWISASSQSSLPDSLDKTVVKLEDINKQVAPAGLTPYEKAAYLLGLKT